MQLIRSDLDFILAQIRFAETGASFGGPFSSVWAADG